MFFSLYVRFYNGKLDYSPFDKHNNKTMKNVSRTHQTEYSTFIDNDHRFECFKSVRIIRKNNGSWQIAEKRK